MVRTENEVRKKVNVPPLNDEEADALRRRSTAEALAIFKENYLTNSHDSIVGVDDDHRLRHGQRTQNLKELTHIRPRHRLLCQEGPITHSQINLAILNEDCWTQEERLRANENF